MSKKKSGPQKTKDADEVKALVMEWFERENKPVTPQSLTDALGSRVAKALVQRTLEGLVAQGKLQAKDLKKARFFYLRRGEEGTAVAAAAAEGGSRESEQAHDKTAEGDAKKDAEGEEDQIVEESAGLPKGILIAQIVALASAIQAEERALCAYRELPTAAERSTRLHTLQEEIERLQGEVAEAESRAAAAATSAPDGPTALGRTLDDAVYSYQKARLLWKERREFTDRLVECVLGDTCSKADLSEMFGITTDAEAGVSFADSAVSLPPSLTGSSHSIRH